MRVGSALGAVVIVAAVCIAYVALSPMTDDPVVPDDGQDGDTNHGQEDEGMDTGTTVLMTVGGRTFTIVLEDNETAEAFVGMLPMAVGMSDLNGNEKYHYLPEELPSDDMRPGTIREGDVMLYSDDCLVVFYETFGTPYRIHPHRTHLRHRGTRRGPGGRERGGVVFRLRDAFRTPGRMSRRDPWANRTPDRSRLRDEVPHPTLWLCRTRICPGRRGRGP